AEKLRRDRRIRDWIFRFAFAPVEHNRLARVLAFFPSDLREKGDESAVVVHRPAVERMVVALRAFHLHAEKRLRRVLRELQRVGLELVVTRGWIFERAAAR